MAKEAGLNIHGPIGTPMEQVWGGSENINGDSGDSFDGEPGLEKGSGGRVKELTYVDNGEFGKVPRAEK